MASVPIKTGLNFFAKAAVSMNDLSPISDETIRVNDWTVPLMKSCHVREITNLSCDADVVFVEFVVLVVILESTLLCF